MTHYPDEYDDMTDEERTRRRNTLMQRRARAARGEDEFVEEDDYYDYDYDDDPRDYNRRRAYDDRYDDRYDDYRRGGYYLDDPAYAPPKSGNGCAQAMLILVGGGLAVVLLLMLFFGQMFSGVGNLFGGASEAVSAPTPDFRERSVAVVQRIQRLQRLETTSYTIQQLIEGRVEGNPLQNLLAGDTLVLNAYGTVEAGIDLSQLSEDDVTISTDGTTLTIKLPPVQIFSVYMDNEKTYVLDREQGLLASANPELESDARRYAESTILNAVCEDGIMQRATYDSQEVMQQFLGLLEYENIEVIPGDIPPCELPADNTTTEPAPVPGE